MGPRGAAVPRGDPGEGSEGEGEGGSTLVTVTPPFFLRS